MSINSRRKAVLAVLGAGASLAALNLVITANTSTHRGPVYNTKPHPEQDRGDTLFNRTEMLNDAKRQKPWNMTAADRGRQ